MRRTSDLSLEDRIGQLFWVGFAGVSVRPELRELIRYVRPGGFILFARNIETSRQVRSLTDALSRVSKVPPFIALDQEGGRVSRLRPLVGPTPTCYDLAQRPDAEAAVRRHATATARALRTLGFNVNFAPVLDLSDRDPGNGIGDRAFGRDAGLVARLALAHIRAHARSGIAPVGKHFPGLGPARADTHLTLPVIERSRRQLWVEDLLPYRRLGRALPVIMVGHAYYPALQGDRPGPATLAQTVVEGLLRGRLDYRGLILTDDLEMGAIDPSMDGARLAATGLAAGNDGLMFCRSAERIAQGFEGLRRALSDGALSTERLDQSLRRILGVKRRFVFRPRPPYSASTLSGARTAFASLTPRADLGADPTARV
jgi:beta-N-acetylhexosaminidase